MRHIIFTTLFSLNLSLAMCSPDTIRVNARLQNIENNLKKSNDSLLKELLYYKVKEDYYSTALSDQSTRFATIIGAIIGLSALLGFGWYNSLIKKIDAGKNYIDTKSVEIKAESDKALKNLEELSEKRDFERLDGLSEFYFNFRNMQSLNLNMALANDPSFKRLADHLFAAGVDLLYLDVLIDICNLPYSRGKNFQQAVKFTINRIQVNFDEVLSWTDLPQQLNAEQISGREMAFSGFGVSERFMNRIIDKNKNQELIHDLHVLKYNINEIIRLKAKIS